MQQEQNAIGCRLKYLQLSHLIYSTSQLVLIQNKRKISTISINKQTAVSAHLEEKPIHTTYHPQLQIFLLLTDQHVFAVNNLGEIIAKIPPSELSGAKHIYVSDLIDGNIGPNDREDMIAFVKGDHFFGATIRLTFQRQMLRHHSMCQNVVIYQSPEYVEGQKLLAKQKILFLWNHMQTFIYKLPTKKEDSIQLIYIYKKISRRENCSLDYVLSISLKVMAVAFQSGVIKLFKFDQTQKYMLQLKGHTGPCKSLFVSDQNPSMLYSIGTDCSLRVWHLRYCQPIYVLRIDTMISEATFITQSLLFGCTNQGHGKSWMLQINSNLLEPASIQSGQVVNLRCDAVWCVAITAENLVIFFPTPVTATKKVLNSQKFQYPEKYGNVKDVCQLDQEQYAITLQNGFSLVHFRKYNVQADNFQLKKLVYQESIVRAKQDNDQFIELIHQKLLGTYLFHSIHDWKGGLSTFKVSSVSFVKSKWLPKWQGGQQQRVAPSKEVSYCILGSDKGQIIFVNIADKMNYYSKVHLHQSEIMFVKQLKSNKQSSDLIFCSMSKDKQFVIWNFSHDEPPKQIFGVSIKRSVSFLNICQQFLILGETSGELSFIQIQIDDCKVSMKKSNNTIGHISSIISVDYMFYMNQHIFLSGSEDGTIKIWKGLSKKLIFQLKLFGHVTALSFIRQGLTILVCHDQQLSFIKADLLPSLKKAQNLLKQPCLQQGVCSFSVRQFFSQEQQSQPRSPIRRPLLMKHQTSTISPTYLQITNKIQLFEKQQFEVTKYNRYSSMDKHYSQSKKSNIPSSNRESQLILPRIKRYSIRHQHTKFDIHEQELLSNIKKLRERTFRNN